jgi:hypothetical protein
MAGEVLAAAVSTVAVLVVAGSTVEALPVEVSAARVVSVVAPSTTVVFVVAVLVGVAGVAIGTVADSLMMSSSAVTASRGGGVGTIPTDTTVTAITRTVTMATADTRTLVTGGPVTTVTAVTDTIIAADQAIPGVPGGGDKPVEEL